MNITVIIVWFVIYIITLLKCKRYVSNYVKVYILAFSLITTTLAEHKTVINIFTSKNIKNMGVVESVFIIGFILVLISIIDSFYQSVESDKNEFKMRCLEQKIENLESDIRSLKYSKFNKK